MICWQVITRENQDLTFDTYEYNEDSHLISEVEHHENHKSDFIRDISMIKPSKYTLEDTEKFKLDQETEENLQKF